MTLPFSLEVDQLKDIIEEKITYSYLDQHIDKPKINLQKLSLLTIIMGETSLPLTRQRNYILATMLVQVALDTHATISENDDVNETMRLSKQLSVLGGDYYSSLYYVLLSETEDIPFIQVLASAIKDVNEKKMSFHFLSTSDLMDYIQLSQSIESHIICSVAHYVGYHYTHIITELILLDLLINEKKHILLNYNPYFFTTKQIKQQLFIELDQIIMTKIDQLEKDLEVTTSKMNQQLKKVFVNITDYYTVLMEEG